MSEYRYEDDASAYPAPAGHAEAPDPGHRLIRASAGSGKTYQLTEHFLGLLRRGAAVDEVLATTFTRKAAGEILGRLIGRLADGDETALLAEVTRKLHRVGVATIDGFFHRLGQGFRFELDLPLDPRLIAEDSPEARQLRAEAIEAVLHAASADDAAFGALLALLRRLHHDASARSVTRAIDDIVTTHAAVYRAAPDRAAWTPLHVKGLLTARELADLVERWMALGDAMPETRTGKPRSLWVKSWEHAAACAQRQDWDGLVSKGVVAKVYADETVFDRTEIPPDWLDVATRWCGHVRGVVLERIARQTAATHELMQRFTAEYERLRAGRGVMLFSDMAHRLAGGAFAGRGVDTDAALAEVYFRLDAAVTHLLLDEFQDTSLDQWQVLSPFVDEIGGTGDGSRSLLVVGDTKQAIYGWRGGCAELFDRVKYHAPLLETRTLAKSYRSSPTVLSVVNRVFGGVAGCDTLNPDKYPEDGAAAAAWAQGFEPHAAQHTALPGYVRLSASPPGSTDDDAAADEAAPATSHERHAAQTIAALYDRFQRAGHGDVASGDVASGDVASGDVASGGGGWTMGVLTRSNRAVYRLLYELRRLGLPASGEGGNPISDHPAVAAVLSALQMADHPGDTASAFHTLNSPVGTLLNMQALGDAAGVARAVRRELLEHGYAATLARWTRALAGDCDAAGLEKLGQLVTLAEGYDASAQGDAGAVLRPLRFVDHVEGARVEASTPAVIRVMTIHRSKGLEFDAVVLPELDGAFNNRFDVLVDRPDPTGPIEGVFRGVNEANRSAAPVLGEAYRQRRTRQRQEDLCTLYVAMTRARQGLYLLVKPAVNTEGKPRRVGQCFAGILRDTLGDPDAGPLAWGDEAWMAHDTDEDVTATAAVAAATPPEEAAGEAATRVVFDHPLRRMRPTVSPSSLHGGGRVRVADLLSRAPSAAQRRGDAVHAALETVAYVDEVGDMPMADGLGELLRRPAVRAALSRRFGEREVLWRERGFVVPDGGRVLRGVFDRVAVEQTGEGRATAAHLIDFKSDRVDAGGEALAGRVAAYRPQLAAYRRALCLMLGLPAEAVTAELVFTGPGVSVAV
ncbi:MAG: UvrD-helicase domain-containing protein [Planctomycetota bacterium]